MDTEKVKQLAIARECLYGARLDASQIDKPMIAIVYSQNEICPGHMHLGQLRIHFMVFMISVVVKIVILNKNILL